ncbi:MAG: YggT family protein [Chloroflexi bacterium]|nr:YggT family protein [Chloroflexota bacterium]
MNYMIYQIINWIFNIIIILLFARVIISWVRPNPYHPTWGKIIEIVYQLTEPLLAPIRRLLPQTGMMDWSPLVLMIGIWVLRQIVVSVLF